MRAVAERVIHARRLELHRGADIAGLDRVGIDPVPALDEEELPHALGRVEVRIVEILADGDLAAENPEVGEIADVLLGHELEHERRRRRVGARLHLRTPRPNREPSPRSRPPLRRRKHRDDRFHELVDADVLGGRGDEERNERSGDAPVGEPLAQLLVGELRRRRETSRAGNRPSRPRNRRASAATRRPCPSDRRERPSRRISRRPNRRTPSSSTYRRRP